MPFAETKAKLIGELLVRCYVLPSAGAMRANMERERRRMFARYVAFERHTMQVDFDRYLQDSVQERRAGERRARIVAAERRTAATGPWA